MTQDTLTQFTPHASSYSPLGLKNLSLITYMRLHCDWYALHSAGNKLLYGHVPEPFPRCGMGSGHTRLAHAKVLYVGLVNRFQGLDH